MTLGCAGVFMTGLWLFLAFMPNLENVLWNALPGLAIAIMANAISTLGMFFYIWNRTTTE